ncbi:MAG: hypothetical protein AAFZ07_04715 [Actinomycetota bacterium]
MKRILHLAAILILAGAACGAPTDVETSGSSALEPVTPATQGVSPDQIESPLSDDALVHPLLAYLAGESRYQPAGAIEISATNDCMASAGFDLPDVELTSGFVSQPFTRAELLSFRSQYGYGMNSEPAANTAAFDAVRSALDARETLSRSLVGAERAAFDQALYGTEGPQPEGEEQGGCLGVGAEALQKAVPALSLPAELQSAMSERLTQGYADIDESGYLSCIRADGYGDVGTVDDLPSRGLESSSAAAELEIAQADAECADRHMWAQIMTLEQETLSWLEGELASR